MNFLSMRALGHLADHLSVCPLKPGRAKGAGFCESTLVSAIGRVTLRMLDQEFCGTRADRPAGGGHQQTAEQGAKGFLAQQFGKTVLAPSDRLVMQSGQNRI